MPEDPIYAEVRATVKSVLAICDLCTREELSVCGINPDADFCLKAFVAKLTPEESDVLVATLVEDVNKRRAAEGKDPYILQKKDLLL